MQTRFSSLIYTYVVIIAVAVLPSTIYAKKPKGTSRITPMGTRRAASLLLTGTFPELWVKKVGGKIPPQFLSWPLPGRRLGRGFGSGNGSHLAIDITAPIGTPVQSMAPGIVAYADNGVRGYGKMVMVLHSQGWVSLYAHLDSFDVKPGDWVRRKGVIGKSGNTGLSRGPHLHFALIIDGKPRDPLKYNMHDVPARRRKIASK